MAIDILSGGNSLAIMQASQEGAAEAAKKVKEAHDVKRIHDAAQEFEAVLISEMIKPMFEGIETSAPFGGGKGEEVFRGMMIQEYGKMLSKNGGIGMSSQIREQMIKMQEEANNATQTIPE
jgi:Rod binding domain-containing protein